MLKRPLDFFLILVFSYGFLLQQFAFFLQLSWKILAITSSYLLFGSFLFQAYWHFGLALTMSFFSTKGYSHIIVIFQKELYMEGMLWSSFFISFFLKNKLCTRILSFYSCPDFYWQLLCLQMFFLFTKEMRHFLKMKRFLKIFWNFQELPSGLDIFQGRHCFLSKKKLIKIKSSEGLKSFGISGAPGRIWKCDPLIRSRIGTSFLLVNLNKPVNWWKILQPDFSHELKPPDY